MTRTESTYSKHVQSERMGLGSSDNVQLQSKMIVHGGKAEA